MAYVPNSGSVVAFQSDPTKLVGTFSVVGLPTNQNVSGSVVAFQGTSPWLTVPTSGSIAAVQSGIRITSIVNSNPSSVIVGTSIFGQLPAGTAVLGSVAVLQGTDPWTVKSSIAGGIFPVSGSVSAVITNTNLNVSGSVAAFQAGTKITSISGQVTVVSSIAGGIFPVSGSVGAQILNTNLNVGGSVVAFLGTNPWPVVNVGSIISLNVGSIITVFQAPSIVGTYSEDSAHTTADKGFFVMGVRNDTVSSFTGSNGEYNPFAHDSAGRVLSKPFAAEEARIEGYHSVVSTSVTTLVAAGGVGIRNYITDVWVVNTGAANSLITFKDGAGSILGYTIAPSAGGSNLVGLQTPIRTGANATFDFQPATASSIIYCTAKGYKAP